MKNIIIKIGGITLLISILLFTAFLSYIYSKQERIVFAATQLPYDYEFEFNKPFKEVNLTTNDAVNLNGVHFQVANSKGVILYFHGNSGDLSRWGAIAEYYTTLQYDILVVDYRTYGKSTGEIDELKMLNDTQIWYNYLFQKLCILLKGVFFEIQD